MADYRLIYRNASTGERTSGLSHLGFRVWIQYQLSADDFGVCAALAEKFQGDCDALLEEPAKRVQAEIENLVTVKLCAVFLDGKRRYLYQPDWQDWQRLKHASRTSLPPPPVELLEKCSPKTRELFTKYHPRIGEGLPPHAGACDASANAHAHADASDPERGPGKTAPVVAVVGRDSVAGRARVLGIASPLDWDRAHGKHAFRADFCGWMCLPESVLEQFAARVVGAGVGVGEAREQVRQWALAVKADWATRNQVPGDDIFDFWRHEWKRTHGSNKPASSVALTDPLAALREVDARG